MLGGALGAHELLPVASLLDEVGFHSLEAWGGATFEAYLARGEDPWAYLAGLAAAAPKTPIQALIRGQNLVGHRHYGDDTVALFVSRARELGVDVFRVFDPLNDLRNMEVAISCAKESGARIQGAMCFALSPAHGLDGWLQLAKGLAELGVDELVIKDTSGLLRPQTTWELVTALVKAVGLPVIVHSHCASGMAPMSYMAAVEAGAFALDTAISPLAWGSSQPAAESVVAALQDGDWDTGLSLDLLVDIKAKVEELRQAHKADLGPFADRVDSDILRYQLPGAMLDDLHRQLDQHQAEARLPEALAEVGRIRRELGHPPLVAPVRQLIATQAVFHVTSGQRYQTVTQELKDYLQGLYGRPPESPSTEIRRLVLGHEDPITIRPADLIEPEVAPARSRLTRRGKPPQDEQLLNQILFPHLKPVPRPPPPPEPPAEVVAAALPTAAAAEEALEEPAAEAAAEAPAVTELEVEVDGEVFKVRVSGGSLAVAATPPAPAKKAVKPGSITAPMQGLIVKVPVRIGDRVTPGDVVAVLEAMKMQNDITALTGGEVTEIYVSEGDVVGPQQAILHVG